MSPSGFTSAKKLSFFQKARFERGVEICVCEQPLRFCCAIQKPNGGGPKNIPVPQQRVDRGILAGEICVDYWNGRFSDAAFRPTAIVTLHRDPEDLVWCSEMLLRLFDTHFLQIGFRN